MRALLCGVCVSVLACQPAPVPDATGERDTPIGAASALSAAARTPSARASSDQPAPPTEADWPQPVRPFPPGLTGELLFQSDREGAMRLYVLDLSTGTVRRTGSPGEWYDEEPDWSPDGRRIAFSSTRGARDNVDIFVMDADESHVIRLTDHASPEQDPSWAPDGRSIFFTGERDGAGRIYRVWLDDKRVESLPSGAARAIMPAAAPDGRYVAYAAQTAMDFQIHLLDLTNGTYRRITRGGGACRPGWSPDGTEIAFVRIEGEPSRLETIRDEGLRVLLADAQLWSYYPAYSPDGRYVAFSVSPDHHEGEDWDLALMDLQQPGRFVRLTSGRGNDRVPDWKPQ